MAKTVFFIYVFIVVIVVPVDFLDGSCCSSALVVMTAKFFGPFSHVSRNDSIPN